MRISLGNVKEGFGLNYKEALTIYNILVMVNINSFDKLKVVAMLIQLYTDNVCSVDIHEDVTFISSISEMTILYESNHKFVISDKKFLS